MGGPGRRVLSDASEHPGFAPRDAGAHQAPIGVGLLGHDQNRRANVPGLSDKAAAETIFRGAQRGVISDR